MNRNKHDSLAERRAALPAEAREELARRLRGEGPSAHSALSAPPRSGDSPLSFTQEGFWLRGRRFPDDASGNVFLCVRLLGPLDSEALQRSCDGLLDRHAVLRSCFLEVDGSPRQRTDPGARLVIRRVQRAEETGDADDWLRAVAAEEAGRPFDLETAPPVRAVLARVGGDHHVLMVTVDHIATDARSNAVLLEDLAALYAAHTGAAPHPPPPVGPQIADLARVQRAARTDGGSDTYWRSVLGTDVPPLDLPTDRPRVPGAARPPGRTCVDLSAESVRALRDLCRSEGTPLFAGLTAIVQTLLYRYSGSPDYLIGVPINGRHRPDLSRTVGPLFSVVPLRTNLADRPTFRQLAARVRRGVADAFDHTEVPADRFEAAAYDVLFVVQDASPPAAEVAGLSVEPVEIGPGTAQCTLTLSAVPAGEGFHITADYDAQVLDRATVEQLLGHLRVLSSALPCDPDRPVDEVGLLTPAEYTALLEEWNHTEADPVLPLVVHEAFAAQARRTPDATALSCGARSVTYTELYRAAGDCAHRLGRVGVGRGDIVGVSVERGPELVVALLGVLMSGAAYLPLDPSYPRERLRRALVDSGARHLVHGNDGRPILEVPGVRALGPDTWGEGPGSPDGWSPPTVGPADVAYVMYTSGSTGAPKGVLVAHRGITNDLDWRWDTTGIGPGDLLLHTVSCSFDPSVWQLFGPLVTGAEVVLATEEELGDPKRVVSLIREHRVSVADFVPSTLVRVLDEAAPGDLDSLSHVFCGGERLPRDLADRFHGATRAALHNQYGPTEATIDTTSHIARPGSSDEVGIGRPIRNKRGYVLDQRMEPVPARVPGELWIGGAGLAYGYVGSPAQTADRFRPDPFGAPGSRVYRSGDLVRHRHDGDLEFVGRVDQQVKINGVRVEPAEVEAALRAHPEVADAAVVVRQLRGRHALAAFAVPVPGRKPERSALRSHLMKRLPVAFLPAYLDTISAIPRDVTGKLADPLLPDPERRASAPTAWLPPAGSPEHAVARLWALVLGEEPTGPDDDFFQCGGDSVLATRLVGEMRRELGVEPSLHDFLVNPTVSGAATLLQRERWEAFPAVPAGPAPRGTASATVPLSYEQERIRLRAEAGAGPGELEASSTVWITGRLDADALADALSAVVARHEALRVRVSGPRSGGGPGTQTVLPPSAVALARTDMTGADREDVAARLRELDTREALDPASGVLLAPTLLSLGPEESVLHLKLHRIAVDGHSVEILARDLVRSYGAAVSVGEPALAPLPVGHPDHALWERAWLPPQVVERAVEEWRGQAPDPSALPGRWPVGGGSGTRAGLSRTLDRSLTRDLGRAASAHGCTVRTLLLAAWGRACELGLGMPIPICVPVSGRDRAETAGAVGRFVNLAAVWTGPHRNGRLRDQVSRVHRSAAHAYGHQRSLPFMALERSLAGDTEPRGSVFPVFFDLSDPVADQAGPLGIGVRVERTQEERSDFALALLAAFGPEGLELTLLYDPSVHSASAAEELFGDFRGHLDVLADPYRWER